VLRKEGKEGEARAELEKAYDIEPDLKNAQQQ
jgi:hypothetical protein